MSQLDDQLGEEIREQTREDGVGNSQMDFCVVGIGASAGGLEALERFFDNTPPDTGMAFVVVQHLSPDYKSLMDELLAKHTKMPIHKVTNGMVVEGNGVYLIPPKSNMTLSEGRLLLTEQRRSAHDLQLPIDVFFTSLARDAGDKAVAVILSGTGSDGSRGVQDVHAAGGLVLVQEPGSAAFDGMPRSAIATGQVHCIARAERLPEKLIEYFNNPTGFSRVTSDDDAEDEEGDRVQDSIYSLLRDRYGVDFAYYKPATIERRLERRVQMTQSGSLEAYLERLDRDSNEIDNLYRDVLIDVTQFFRDPPAFERLRSHVIPELLRNKPPDEPVRVWVAGCASGEEAYSLAMLFHEAAHKLQNPMEIRIFATDAHKHSLETASAGVYTANSVRALPSDLRERYLIQRGELFHVHPELREIVVFAPHDLTRDPPFTKLDFISCRNVMIYFKALVQRRVLALFHFGLRLDGVVFLGSSESLGDLGLEFEVLDPTWRIYRKSRDVRLSAAGNLPLAATMTGVIRSRRSFIAQSPVSGNSTADSVLEVLLERYVPPSVLVDENFETLHIFGDASRLLTRPKGRPTHELLKMVEGDLRISVSAGLHRANRDGEKTVFEGVRSGQELIRLVVEPYIRRGRKYFLVSFEEPQRVVPEESQINEFRADDESLQRIIDLESELDFTKQTLQTTIEEMESSNEELQATNEELVSANEELQSTNEELHSVNEELYTVNSECQRKISELTELTTDMENLLRSTDIATIFLDRDLRIRKFTPAITAAFNVLDQDVGRPIEHIAYNVDNPDLLKDAKKVLQTGEAIEKEVRSNANGCSYLQRVQPYRAVGRGRIDGVVFTFVNLTSIKDVYREVSFVAQTLVQGEHDLQEFAYAVSHDLQAPIRHIADHTRRLIQLKQEQEDPTSERSTRVIEISTMRLQRMINALLEYSRVFSRGKSLVMCPLDDCLNDALAVLEAEILSSGAAITREELPSLEVDQAQIARVFQALVHNAIQYCDHPIAKIHISAKQERDEWAISVSDNGIGIQPQHQERIFQVFQRLGFKESVEGVGMGLGLCKRILRRHRGSIVVASEVGRGSTFVFRLPKEQKLQNYVTGAPITGTPSKGISKENPSDSHT